MDEVPSPTYPSAKAVQTNSTVTELRIFGSPDIDLSKVIFTNLAKLCSGQARLLMHPETFTDSNLTQLSTASIEQAALLITPTLRELIFTCRDPADLIKINELTKKCNKKFQIELEVGRVCLKEFLEQRLLMHVYISQVTGRTPCRCFNEVSSVLQAEEVCQSKYRLDSVRYRFEEVSERVRMLKVSDVET